MNHHHLYRIPNRTSCIQYSEKNSNHVQWEYNKFIMDMYFTANEMIGVEDNFYKFKRTGYNVIFFIKAIDVEIL